MGALRVNAFDGLVPRLSPTLLGDNFAQAAENVKLYSKELRYWRGPSLALNSALAHPLSVYRLYNSAGASSWLMWNADVDVAPSPVSDTTEARVYFTGDGVPKKTNYSLATTGSAPFPVASQLLGVPKPGGAPAATVTVAGTGTAETRAYVYTYVNTFGAVLEEGPPSDPVSVTTGLTAPTITIDTFTAPPGGYNITHRRIYRTVVGATSTDYIFVAQITIATTTYADTLTAAQLGDALQTIGWIAPPATLAGLVALPTGALAGFVGNTVYFSEPFYPHAWPLAYAISVPARIVGLSILGSTVVVLTETTPFLIYGGTPGSMSTEQVMLAEPCVGKGTIARDNDGVVYASPNGLVGISSQARDVLTKNLFTADEWQALVPSTMKGTVLNGRYIGVFPNVVPSKAMVLTRDDSPALTYLNLPASVLHVDAKDAKLYYVHSVNGDIYQLDADENQPLPYEWRSKRWEFPHAVTYSVLKLDAEFSQLADADAYNTNVAAVAALNATAFAGDILAAVNTAPLNVYQVNGSTLLNQPTTAAARTAQLVITGDGEVVASLTIDSLDPVRLPPFKCREMEFSLFGNINIRSLAMATTIEELRQL